MPAICRGGRTFMVKPCHCDECGRGISGTDQLFNAIGMCLCVYCWEDLREREMREATERRKEMEVV